MVRAAYHKGIADVDQNISFSMYSFNSILADHICLLQNLGSMKASQLQYLTKESLTDILPELLEINKPKPELNENVFFLRYETFLILLSDPTRIQS